MVIVPGVSELEKILKSDIILKMPEDFKIENISFDNKTSLFYYGIGSLGNYEQALDFLYYEIGIHPFYGEDILAYSADTYRKN